jgi:hypothetical protein
MLKKQAWIKNAPYDLLTILSVPFVCLALFVCFQGYFINSSEVDVLQWFVLVLCIDVAHVYSSLYRTYLDKKIVSQLKFELVLIPVIILIISVAVHYISPAYYWRLMAYLAAFHFVRQQYGFLKLYSREEKPKKIEQIIDDLAIYSATLYPLLYWHLNEKINVQWFVENDFVHASNNQFNGVLLLVFIAIQAAFYIKTLFVFIKNRKLNIPKVLIVLGTALSWYLGIVMYDNDLIFTFFNVICHGIPYMALVWAKTSKKSILQKVKRFPLFVFIASILVFAFTEEFFWDIFVWKSHYQIFGFAGLEFDITSSTLMSFIVPILSLPQLTHYVLDGFIWKRNLG